MRNNKLFTAVLIFLGIIGVIMCYTAANKSRNEVTKNIKISMERSIMASNVDELYYNISDEKSATTVVMNLTETLKYIPILIEDVPKAENTYEYYDINSKAINDIFGLKTTEDFNIFYEKLKSLKSFNKYEIVEGSVSNDIDNYYFSVKLSGDGQAVFSIIVSVKNNEKNEGEIIWMGEKRQ